MPLLDFELASKRMQYEGGSAGLRPSLINPGAGAHAFSSPPQLDINAGRVAFTPVQPPPVGYPTPEEVSAKAANKLLEVWTTAAFEFQEREDAVTAQAVHSQIQMGFDMLLRGDGDKPGYNSSTVVGTSPEDYARIRQDYDSLMASADKLTQLTLAGVTPNARVKAANAIMDSRRMLQNNALAHREKLVAAFREKQYDVASTAFIPSAVEAARTTMSEGLLYDFSEGFASRRLAAVDTFNQEVIQPAVAALGAVYAHGPMDATPESIINSRIIQHLAMSPHEQDQEIALLLYAVNADKIVDIKERKYALDAIQGIQDRRAANIRYNTLVRDEQERQTYEMSREVLEDIGIAAAQSGNPERIREALDMAYSYGDKTFKAMQNIISAYSAAPIAHPDIETFTAQAIIENLSPGEAARKATEAGIPLTKESLSKIATAYTGKVGDSFNQALKDSAEAVKGRIKEYKDSAQDTWQLSFLLDPAVSQPIETELIETMRVRTEDEMYRYMNEVRERDGSINIREFTEHMRAWRADTLGKLGIDAAFSDILTGDINIPRVYDLRYQPQADNGGFSIADNPFSAMASLEHFVNTEGYITDPTTRDIAREFIHMSRDPDTVEFFRHCITSGDINLYEKAIDAVESFSSVYEHMQINMWRNKAKIDPSNVQDYTSRMRRHIKSVMWNKFGLKYNTQIGQEMSNE